MRSSGRVSSLLGVKWGDLRHSAVRKYRLVCAIQFYSTTQNRTLGKTGSGQTQEKLTERDVATAGRLIRSISMAMGKVLLLAVFSGCTAVLSAGAQTSQISSYSDLSGSSVCVNVDASSFQWINRNNNGFGMVERDSTQRAIDAFWEGACEAMIYDAPILQYSIIERRCAKRLFCAIVTSKIDHSTETGSGQTQGNAGNAAFSAGASAHRQPPGPTARQTQRWSAQCSQRIRMNRRA